VKYFEVRSENLTNLGGPMGSESVHDNWRRSVSTFKKARAIVEQDYKKECGGKPEKVIVWTWDDAEKIIRTQDLRFVMYYIREVTVE
jgi:hypothetical protein